MFGPLMLTASSVLIVFLYLRLRYKRLKEFAHLPQLPPSILWGHMKAFDEFRKHSRPDEHPDFVFGAMNKALGNPPVMVVDMRPISMPVALITSHDVAEQVTKSTRLFPWSLRKTPTIADLTHLIGASSIVSAEGEKWKSLRKRFAPGFSHSHLMSLLPCILDKTEPFIMHIDKLVNSQQEFALEQLLTNLTIDIIGAITMDEDLGAQNADKSKVKKLVPVFFDLLQTYGGLDLVPQWLTPGLVRKRKSLSKQVDQILQGLVQEKFGRQKTQEKAEGKSRSILSLSFQGIDHLTPELLSYTTDQIRSFFFAGHDTTSILMGWALYELSLNPRALKKVRAELNELFGPDPNPETVRDKLYDGGEGLVRRMTYISAVIKETLRLHPPASTGRYTKPGTGFTVRTKEGDEYCLDGCVIYNCHSILHRDRSVYGDSADDFLPERWLKDLDSLEFGGSPEKMAMDTFQEIPLSAWRPYERGPRNCIGQELANLEAQVLLAITARKYDFIKVGLGEVKKDSEGQPVIDAKGKYEVERELYPMLQVTTKPVDGMRMKVQLAPNPLENV